MPEPARETEFYVGYFPMPPGLAVFLRRVVPLALAAIGAAALLLGRAQTDPGPAVWDDGVAKQFRGTLRLVPFPVLVEPDGRASLLVEMGKRGVRDGADRGLAALEGRGVVVSGWTLDRNGRRIIELEPGAEALRADVDGTGESGASLEMTSVGPAVLRGEIVHSKCFLGAMKPGDGKPHKACATLCVKGGIPPVLVSRRAGGGFEYTLVVDAQGEPLGEALWPWIAEPVVVRGEMELIGGLRRLRVESDGIASAIVAGR
jgi:hypothetical protein